MTEMAVLLKVGRKLKDSHGSGIIRVSAGLNKQKYDHSRLVFDWTEPVLDETKFMECVELQVVQ